jgi:arylformamidase
VRQFRFRRLALALSYDLPVCDFMPKNGVNQLSKTLSSFRIVDLSHTIYGGMPVYPTLPPPRLEKISYIQRDLFNITKMKFALHSGTHVESSMHVIEPGKSLDEYSVSAFIKAGTVIDLSSKKGEISRTELEAYSNEIVPGGALALYTGIESKYGCNSDYLFRWRGLSQAASAYLIKRHVSILGTDGISIAGWDDSVPAQERLVKTSSHRVHSMLLANGVIVVEELANLHLILRGSSNKKALFFFEPLKIRGAEASPVRALAFC